MTFVVGKSYRVYLSNEGKIKKIYILARVDEEMIVYKYWGFHRKRWLYRIEREFLLSSAYEYDRKEKVL